MRYFSLVVGVLLLGAGVAVESHRSNDRTTIDLTTVDLTTVDLTTVDLTVEGSSRDAGCGARTCDTLRRGDAAASLPTLSAVEADESAETVEATPLAARSFDASAGTRP